MCDKVWQRWSKLVKNSVTYFMEGPLACNVVLNLVYLSRSCVEPCFNDVNDEVTAFSVVVEDDGSCQAFESNLHQIDLQHFHFRFKQCHTKSNHQIWSIE